MSTQQRSRIPSAIGILNIIFCSLGILGSLFSITSYLFINAFAGYLSPPAPELSASLADRIAQMLRMSFILTFVGMAGQGAGLGGGICLLTRRRQGVILSDIYAGLAIAVVVGGMITSRIFIGELGNELSQIIAGPAGAGSWIEPFLRMLVVVFVRSMQSLSFLAVLGAAYPIVVLALVNLPSVRLGWDKEKEESRTA
jgi:hypothetical protein